MSANRRSAAAGQPNGQPDLRARYLTSAEDSIDLASALLGTHDLDAAREMLDQALLELRRFWRCDASHPHPVLSAPRSPRGVQ